MKLAFHFVLSSLLFNQMNVQIEISTKNVKTYIKIDIKMFQHFSVEQTIIREITVVLC